MKHSLKLTTQIRILAVFADDKHLSKDEQMEFIENALMSEFNNDKLEVKAFIKNIRYATTQINIILCERLEKLYR